MNSIQTVLLQIEMYRLSEQNSPVIWLTQVFSPLITGFTFRGTRKGSKIVHRVLMERTTFYQHDNSLSCLVHSEKRPYTLSELMQL